MRTYAPWFLTLLLTVATGEFARAADSIYVQVRNSQIRKSPQYWAPSVGAVRYGQALTPVEDAQEGWVKVRQGKGGSTGYIPLSAVSSSPVSARSDLKRGAPEASTRQADEVVLAGKGINSEVEKALAKSNSGMNFSAVNRVERLSVSSGDLSQFAREGNLGGAKK